MEKVIHFKGLPCITGKKKMPTKYVETFRKEKVTCEACIKKINNPDAKP